MRSPANRGGGLELRSADQAVRRRIAVARRCEQVSLERLRALPIRDGGVIRIIRGSSVDSGPEIGHVAIEVADLHPWVTGTDRRIQLERGVRDVH